MLIDLHAQSPLVKYRILSNTITPRPIAWVSSISQEGVVNLAPFSFFGLVSSHRPIFSLVLGTKTDGTSKDTLYNATTTKHLTISCVRVEMIPLLEQSAKELPHNTSEASTFNIGLKMVDSAYPPMVEGALVAYFCTVYDVLEFGGSEHTLLLEAKRCFIDEQIYEQDLRFLPPHVGRVGKYYVQASTLIDPSITQ